MCLWAQFTVRRELGFVMKDVLLKPPANVILNEAKRSEESLERKRER